MANQNTSMVCKGQEPLCEIPINGTYILGIYKGTLSEYDILLKYRQKEDGKWSRIRTPKHIHWAVDMLVKQHYSEPHETDLLLKQFAQSIGTDSSVEDKRRSRTVTVTREIVDRY